MNWFSEPRYQKSFRGTELEWVDEVSDLLELLASRVNLVDHILKTEDLAADLLFNQFIGLDLHTVVVDLSERLFVDQL